MKRIKKMRRVVYLFLGVSFLGGTGLAASEIAWDSDATYLIPDDGNTYYLDYSKSLTDDLTINGTLAIWSNGILDTDSHTVCRSDCRIGLGRQALHDTVNFVVCTMYTLKIERPHVLKFYSVYAVYTENSDQKEVN